MMPDVYLSMEPTPPSRRWAQATTVVPGNGQRLRWLMRTTILALLAGLALSLRLWLSSRSYPLTPISPLLPTTPFPLDAGLFALLLGLLLAAALAGRARPYLAGSCLLAFALALFDQSRWQTWFYQYLTMLGALALLPWPGHGGERREAALNTCRFIVASIYIWSGVQKVNAEFLTVTFPWFVAPFAALFPDAARNFLNTTGAIVPFIETGIGLGLLAVPLRRAGVIAAILMHLFIISVIGPTGYGWHTIAWPWNLAAIALSIILFWNTDTPARRILWNRSAYHLIVLVLFGLMPLFSLFGRWDDYLSSALYSGNTRTARITMGAATWERLPESVRRHVRNLGGTYVLNPFDWSLSELGVPPYPERRIYQNIARHLCGSAEHPSDLTLTINEKPHWLDRTRQQSTYDCSQLR